MLILSLIAAHGFAAGMIWMVPWPYGARLGLLAALAGSAVFYLRRDGLRAMAHSIVALRLASDCRVEIQTRRGEWLEGELLGTTFVTPGLAVVNMKPRERRFARHVVIFPDAVDPEDFRRLRVLLRWKCGRGPA
jgi:toxin CptA